MIKKLLFTEKPVEVVLQKPVVVVVAVQSFKFDIISFVVSCNSRVNWQSQLYGKTRGRCVQSSSYDLKTSCMTSIMTKLSYWSHKASFLPTYVTVRIIIIFVYL